jgi:hypothetical protein
MSLSELFDQAIEFMEEVFSLLEAKVPRPQRVPLKDGYWFRYREKSPQQAIVQKLARYVSGLRAARLLHRHGFVQEQASLQRMLDEFSEDISFLALGLKKGEMTRRHQDYLRFFYEEEFANPDAPLDPEQRRRPSVPRKKIQSYLVQHITAEGLDPAMASAAFKTVGGSYSGFVHGASPQIMDMYGGDPPRFHLAGMLGTPRIEGAERDLWNYVFRGLLALGSAAAAFGEDELFQGIVRAITEFESQSGTSFFSPP